jgi:hypothetical protein
VNARATRRLGALLALAGLFASCANDTVAGKTTTTSNGGDLLALGPDGAPLAGCVALAARSWNPVTGKPGAIDTIRGDAAGVVRLGEGAYAFVEIRDGTGNLGGRIAGSRLLDKNRQSVPLDTLRRIQGRWADRAGIAKGRLFLDSSLASAPLGSHDGSFAFEKIPPGEFTLMLDADTQAVRPMGRVSLSRDEVRYTGSGNVVLDGDTTRSPLWIDDFESGGYWPLLRPSVPGVSPWFMWWTETDMARPASADPESVRTAIGPDSLRPGRTFQARFRTTGTNALIAVGLTNMQLDLRSRTQVCLSYRADSPLRIEFQRDSVGGVRPTIWSTLPPAPAWRDTCAATSGFAATSDTPDSLATWDAFARRVLVIQFVASTGATRLDLDDIRLR